MKKKLEFTEQELNIIIYSLRKQPHEVVDELIHNLVLQLQAQPKTESTETKE